MATMVIEDAATMRAHAETYVVHGIAAEVMGKDAGMYMESARYCREVAAAIEAGRIVPGDYRWGGTHGEFQSALLAGELSPTA